MSTTSDDPRVQGGALCAEIDPERWFPEKGGSTREAKAICTRCELQDPCLRYALEHNIRFGIWGGKSEQERRRLLRGDSGKATPAQVKQRRARVAELTRAGHSASEIAVRVGCSPRQVTRDRQHMDVAA